MPNWDAVGKTTMQGRTTWLLAEAKAHTQEMFSHCGAENQDSLKHIQAFLTEAIHELHGNPEADLTRNYYQYCNRLATLHYLNKNGIEAQLLMLYFTGDRHEGRVCPKNKAEWQDAIKQQDAYFALSPQPAWVHKIYLKAIHRGEEKPRARAAGAEDGF